jgi:hypothetical protein
MIHGSESYPPRLFVSRSDYGQGCCKIAISLKMSLCGSKRVMAFHEKAGRSQVSSFFILLDKGFSRAKWTTVAMLPSALSRSDSFPLGACWAFSVQPVLPSVWRPVVLLLQSGTWARPLTQSPELGFGLCLFSSWNGFDSCFAVLFYAAAATITRLPLCNGSYTSPLTHR